MRVHGFYAFRPLAHPADIPLPTPGSPWITRYWDAQWAKQPDMWHSFTPVDLQSEFGFFSYSACRQMARLLVVYGCCMFPFRRSVGKPLFPGMKHTVDGRRYRTCQVLMDCNPRDGRFWIQTGKSKWYVRLRQPGLNFCSPADASIPAFRRQEALLFCYMVHWQPQEDMGIVKNNLHHLHCRRQQFTKEKSDLPLYWLFYMIHSRQKSVCWSSQRHSS